MTDKEFTRPDIVDKLESVFKHGQNRKAEKSSILRQSTEWVSSRLITILGTADDIELYFESIVPDQGGSHAKLFRGFKSVQWRYKDNRYTSTIELAASRILKSTLEALAEQSVVAVDDAVTIVDQVIQEIDRKCTVSYITARERRERETFGEKVFFRSSEIPSSIYKSHLVSEPITIRPPAVEKILVELTVVKGYLPYIWEASSGPKLAIDGVSSIKTLAPKAEPIRDQFDVDMLARTKLLARHCLPFKLATPEIQQKAWEELTSFTRPQWAMFFVETTGKKKAGESWTEAISRIIKPKIRIIEEISGFKQMRGVSINERSKVFLKDQRMVAEVANLLRASSVLADSD